MLNILFCKLFFNAYFLLLKYIKTFHFHQRNVNIEKEFVDCDFFMEKNEIQEIKDALQSDSEQLVF